MAEHARSVWVVDLDGVIWLADQAIPGSAEAVATARAAGVRVMFVTNNSSMTVRQYAANLAGMGIETPLDDIVTSAQAAASLLVAGSTAVICAGDGVREALDVRGVRILETGPADAVVVGWNRDFDFAALTAACRAIWGGARFVATNRDVTYPTPDGLLPGAGAIVAAVAAATGAEPEVAGKPHEPVVATLKSRAGRPVDLVVGDRLDTDGELAKRLGVPFGLVLTGVTRGRLEPGGVEPAHVAADLRSLVAAVIGGQ